jgi:hypothetical protein
VPLSDPEVHEADACRFRKLHLGFAIAGESEHDCGMFAIAFLFVRVLCDRFKSRRRLEAEILVLRHTNSFSANFHAAY